MTTEPKHWHQAWGDLTPMTSVFGDSRWEITVGREQTTGDVFIEVRDLQSPDPEPFLIDGLLLPEFGEIAEMLSEAYQQFRQQQGEVESS